ncbi:MAG: hypothetical protein ACK5MP_03550 [Nostocoides sp.]
MTQPLAEAPGPRAGSDRLGAALVSLVIGGGLAVLLVSALAVVLGALGGWSPYAGWVAVLAAAALTVKMAPSLPMPRLDKGSAVALVVLTLGVGIWLSATHSQQVLPRRDAGSNLQAAIALATTGQRILHPHAHAIGAPTTLQIPGITLASPAFYQVGTAPDPAIQPQFVIGPAALYSLVHPLGINAMIVVAAWAMALAMLGLGLIGACVFGARWGPVVLAATAVIFPMVHTGRTTLSEPLAEVTLTAGLLALLLAARSTTSPRGASRWAVLAGTLVGGTTLVRIDGLRETILLIPVIAAYAAQRARWAAPLAISTLAATVSSLGAAWWLSYRYLGDIAASLIPLLALGVILAVGCAALLAAGRAGRLTRLQRPLTLPWLPRAVAGLVIVIGAVLASRPLWQVVRQDPNDPGARYVAGMQARAGLPVDGGRTYAEHTVAWLSWWVGPVALLLAAAALAVMAGRITAQAQTGRLPFWFGPVVVAAGSTLLTLYRPGITPDHPWADRRLLIALPFVVLLVVAAAAWSAHRWPTRIGAGVAVVLLAAMAGPSVSATWPHRLERVENGSLRAVQEVCAGLGEGDVVLAVDARASTEWPQVIRGQCQVPTLAVQPSLREDPARLAGAVAVVNEQVSVEGQRLVLMAANDPGLLTSLGARQLRQVTDTDTYEDEHALTSRPTQLRWIPMRVWFALP